MLIECKAAPSWLYATPYARSVAFGFITACKPKWYRQIVHLLERVQRKVITHAGQVAVAVLERYNEHG